MPIIEKQFCTYTLLIDGLASPVAFVHKGNLSYIVDQIGYIYIYNWDLARNSKIVKVEEGKGIKYDNYLIPLLLDISERITPLRERGEERGLLQMILHPLRNLFYLYFTVDPPLGKSYNCVVVLEEWTFIKEGARPIRPIIQWAHPEANHFGSPLGFSSNGLLYLATGDGGGAGDKHGLTGNALNLKSPWGKVLSVNVNSPEPIVEVVSIGFRNPWRGSFTSNGFIILGDVGQDIYEGIHIVGRDENYGWRTYENGHIFDPQLLHLVPFLTPPIIWYKRPLGKAVIGGYQINTEGDYIFGDYTGGDTYDNIYLYKDGILSVQAKDRDRFRFLTSLSRDSKRNIYGLFTEEPGLVGNGGIYRIDFT